MSRNDFNKVYLDYNATTPVDQRVLQAMLPAYTTTFGNPSSENTFGADASVLVDKAREQAAQLIAGAPRNIIFTSGATEGCNLAIKGAAQAYASRGNHIIVSAVEHKAVLEPCRRLAASGCELTVLRPDSAGRILPQQVSDAVNQHTILVCVMMANNIIGTINPVDEIGEVCKKRGVVFFCDATQAAGKIPVDAERIGADLMVMSSHKMYGPKGAGALYIRQKNPRIRLVPQIDGGGQEYGLRSGTLNVPGIVGFGAACELCKNLMSEESVKICRLRDRLEDGLLQGIPDIVINGRCSQRIPNTSNVLFKGIDAQALLKSISEIAVSMGSACEAGGFETSYVLSAIGISHEAALSSVRFSLGRFTTEEQIDFTVDRVVCAVNKLKSETVSQ